MPMVNIDPPVDIYRKPARLVAKKEHPRPISNVGGGRGGSLQAFVMGAGGRTDNAS